MSILFSPVTLGPFQLKNRFIFSACEDNMAAETGRITKEILHKNKMLARGEVGLIISSHMFVHELGRTRRHQTGIHSDDTMDGLKDLVETVHPYNCRIVFQLGHAGLQTSSAVIGREPLGPTSENTMDGENIEAVIQAFRAAAERAVEAGADGVQIHAAHGYLINQFLSPHYNHRRDTWGGSDENRFRLLKEIVTSIRTVLPKDRLLLVKLNTHDHTPSSGITPPMARRYAEHLAALAIDGLEVSCGTSLISPWNMCRGEVPVQELLQGFPESHRPRIEGILKTMEGKFTLREGYNVEAAKLIRPVMAGIPLFAVGGWRTVESMEKAVANGDTDFIPICRPLIREPLLVRNMKAGKTREATCTSCNKCLAALAGNRKVRCYRRTGPQGTALS